MHNTQMSQLVAHSDNICVWVASCDEWWCLIDRAMLSQHRSLYTVKLCYSESGRPRHIFSLLPSSRYSQMTNLPRETKGNNLGTSAIDLRSLQCDGGCVTLGLHAGWERQRHRAHSSQTKMRGGRGGGGEGITHRTRTRLSLFFFVTGSHEMCPTGNLTTRWEWGEWRELLWPGRIENLSLLPRWLSTNSR